MSVASGRPPRLMQDQGASSPAASAARRPIIILATTAALLLGVYAAFGYLVAPGLIRNQVQDHARARVGQELALGEIRVDPFGLKVDIDGIAIPAASPMVSVRSLHLDFAGTSLFTDSYRFDTVRINGPHVKAVVDEDGKLNLLDLVPPPRREPLPDVLIANLTISDGAAFVADYSRTGRPEKRLAPIGFSLQDFHTTRDEGGGFRLTGTSDRGEAFSFAGKLSMAPIASHGGIAIRGLKAASIQAFAADLLPVALQEGSIDLDVAYAAAYAPTGTTFRAELPRVTLTGFKVSPGPDMLRADIALASLGITDTRLAFTFPAKGAATSTASIGGVALREATVTGTGPARGETIRLAAADVEGIRADPSTSALAIGAIRLAGLNVGTSRARNGAIGLLALVPPAPKGAAATPAATIGEISLSDANILFTDNAVRPAATWRISPLTLTARGTGDRFDGPLKLSVSGTLNRTTGFSADGSIDAQGKNADIALRVTNFPLAAGVPYAVDFPALALKSGTASADGRLILAGGNAAFTGNAAIDNLNLIETYRETALLAWKRLQLTGIDATPRRVGIARANLSGPYGELVILQDGTLNVQRLVTMNPTPIVTPAADAAPPPRLTRAQRRAEAARLRAEKQAAAAQARAALAAPLQQPDIPVLLKQLVIDGGTLRFADNSLNPAFAADIKGLKGRVSNISNRPDAVARMELSGYVIDRFSPVSIAGEVNPLQYDRRTNVDMAFRNIELPVFNPYSGRYAGYAIAKGKLTTELGYTIDNRALDARHHIVIDQLEWGDATDSKDKVPLPLKFATSLLKDRNGVIDLDVPVKGTLDDPEFKLGPIVWKIIGNLITKVITAPFSALGDLFGGREDVQFIDFEPGSAALPGAATANLAGIAKGLAEKTELRLDIPAGPGLTLDAVALADRQIAAAAMAREVKKGMPADLAALDPDKRHDRLEDLYKARLKSRPRYPAAREAADEAKDARLARETEWLMAELRKQFAPAPEELAALGKARADAVRLALLETASAPDAARLFISARESATEAAGKARMELKLE